MTIYVVTVWERDELSGRSREVVSHGFDSETFENVVMPPETPAEMGLRMNPSVGMWYVPEHAV